MCRTRITESVPSIDLSVVIPAYNEEARIGPTLRRILDYLQRRQIAFEVIVVDDGSTDQTVSSAEMYVSEGVRILSLGSNRGKGAAVRHGVLTSTGHWVLVSDADLSTPIEDLERLQGLASGADLILGSRALPDSNITKRQPLLRELMGKMFNLIVRVLGLTDFRDTQCGFKLMQGVMARQLLSEARIDGFAWDVEFVGLATARGYRVAETAVTWRDEPASRVRLVRDSLRMLWDVLRVALHSKHSRTD